MDDILKLANRLYEVVLANLTTIECWGYYLTEPEFDKEPELRNKLGTIWISSLIDTLEAESRFLPEIAKEASEKGFDSIVHNSKQLQNFCVLVSEVLEQYTRDEQLFLTNLRNQWTHTYFANRHQDFIKVKYALGGRIISERIPDSEYHAAIRPFFSSETSLDQTLQPLVARALNKELRYWSAMGIMQKNKDLLYETLRSGGKIKITV